MKMEPEEDVGSERVDIAGVATGEVGGCKRPGRSGRERVQNPGRKSKKCDPQKQKAGQ